VRRLIQLVIFGLCVAFSVSAVYNVFSDNADVERMAAHAACAGGSGAGVAGKQAASGGCRPQMTRLQRTPFGQTFEFTTTQRAVEVRCERAFVLAGEYSCKVR
jgi:hypothetical protein